MDVVRSLKGTGSAPRVSEVVTTLPKALPHSRRGESLVTVVVRREEVQRQMRNICVYDSWLTNGP